MHKRQAALRGILREKKLDALVLWDEVSRFYATGFHSSAGLVVLTAEGGYFGTDFRYIEDARALTQEYALVEFTAQNPQIQWLDSLLPGKTRVGFESKRMSAEEWTRRQKAMPRVKWIPIDDALMALRAVKDDGEVAALRRAQQIAQAAFGQVIAEVLRAGVTERAVAAELVYRCLRLGAEGMSFPPIVVSGENGSKPHGTPSDRVIRPGDFVTMDFGCVKDGYCSDMTRTVAVGKPTEEMRRVYHIVLQAQLAGLAAARAGVQGKAIDTAARSVIEQNGYGPYFGHGFGHGIGLEIHEPPNANPSEERYLPAGAVISAEPGIYLPGRFGVRIEDVVLLTPNGHENLTTVPKELLTVDS